MKTLVKQLGELKITGRWDIDFHLPPEGIRQYPEKILNRIDEVADIVKAKRDPGKKPEEVFQYIDISSIDVSYGLITNPQELTGEEAPSRARKVVSAFDVIISTCRPTRGAIAVVPVNLHNQIASTAFSVIHAKENVNPLYLYYAIRLPSTLEQFRKWSTGSSYPAILDDDVRKTKIPMPSKEEQDIIAVMINDALIEHDKLIKTANVKLSRILHNINASVASLNQFQISDSLVGGGVTITEINEQMKLLPRIDADNIDESDLFENDEVTTSDYASLKSEASLCECKRVL